MRTLTKKLGLLAIAGALLSPFLALAATSESNALENAITLGYYISSLGFLIASLLMISAVKGFGKSTLGSIFSYILIGTGIFFVITIFQKLGGDFFGIDDASMDIWWHLMFYMAFAFYFYGLKLLVGLGDATTDPNQGVRIGAEKLWGAIAIIFLAVIFIIPASTDNIVTTYNESNLATLGLHHFLAFIIAGIVGGYLISAKKKLGQIGKAIANPMIIAIWAFAFQHFWELLFESWKTVDVTSQTGEGGEKIFLVIAAICLSYSAVRLKSFAKQG